MTVSKNKLTKWAMVFSISIVSLVTMNVMFFNATTANLNGPTYKNVSSSKRWRAGQILVQPKPGLSEEKLKQILSQHQAKAIDKISSLRVHIVSVPEQAEEAIVRALSNNPNIDFAELDMFQVPNETIVNDPQYSGSWHLPKIHSSYAWDVSKADGIVIAILDSGVDSTHPDLKDKLVPGFNSVVTDTAYPYSTSTEPGHPHGTWVAGSVAATTNNGIGISSIAYNAKIMPIRVSNDPTGWAYWSDIARGLTWAADHGAKVANISYEAYQSSTIASSANYLLSKGGVTVCSAGNSGINPGYTDVASIITVSATDSNDVKAGWSNYGNFVDVSAPGVSILTTNPGGGFVNVNGTSFSSPITAGVIALIMSANPSLSPNDIELVLENSAYKISGENFNEYYGNGRVDAAAAVELALLSQPKDLILPSVSFSSPSSGSTVNGLVNVDINAADNIGIASVSLYVNGILVGTDSSAPYSLIWDSTTFADGASTLKLEAVDLTGNKAIASLSLNVKNSIVVDNSNPTVTITNPLNGSKVSGSISVKVNAKDDVAIAKIDLLIDGKLLASSSTSSLTYSWNTRKVSAGNHSVQAVATDTSGKISTVSITVSK